MSEEIRKVLGAKKVMNITDCVLRIKELEAERDRLKAELEKEYDRGFDIGSTFERTAQNKDRDLWKAKAEKLAGLGAALLDSPWGELSRQRFKEALAEFEEGK